ncbi:MAG: tetratricopeptide repeat protein, partial [Gemmatimonadetes bacterium]|nr:tetratricopeptide repeat protein [Gemmatimonadota bacterium]
MPEKRSRGGKRQGRPQAAPPALTGLGQAFEGHGLLEERSGEGTLLLWQSLRDVLLWASTPADQRNELFVPGSESHRAEALDRAKMDRKLKIPLLTIAQVLEEGAEISAADLASACRKVSRWADEQGLPRMAIWYAQAAAATMPVDAEPAYTVGLLCRRNAEYERAETWFRRAMVLARRSGDNQSYALAWIGIGNLYIRRGDFLSARKALKRALRRARKGGLRRPKAMALHDLFTIAVELIEIADAEALARQTYRAYGPRHPRLPVLAHDVASFWLLQGYYRRALVVYEAILELITHPAERLLILSTIARAAAGARRRDIFTNVWVESWEIIDRKPDAERICSALLNLAYASATLRDWERSEIAARLAVELAAKRK